MKKFFVMVVLALLFALPASAEVILSEVMASNGVYTNGEAYDWVEIHNPGKSRVDLSGCFLSDSEKDLCKWAFPEGTAIKGGEYLLVYLTGEKMAPGKNKTFYANFKISAEGDQLFLTDKEGNLLAEMAFGPQFGNVSYGIAGEEWGFFAAATPGKKNEKQVYPGRAETPEILTPGGFYAQGVTVQAKAPGNAV